MPMHPLPVLINNGVPVTLSSDDPAIFGNLNLSYDFFQVGFLSPCDIHSSSPSGQVLVSSEISGLATLAVAARDSIEVRLARK